MKRTAIALIFALAGLLAGCTKATPSSAPTPSAQGSFPVMVTVAGATANIPARPTRIVSMSPSATQMLYAIGAGPQVVAVDKYSTDPQNAPRTDLTGSETSPEGYMTFRPDLVVVAFDTGGALVSQLKLLHVATLVLPPATTINDTYDQFRALGDATGHRAAADAEVASIGQHLDAVVAGVGARAKGLTYYQEIDNTLFTATSKTFIGALYARLGMVNIADPADHDGSGYPQLNAEFLIQANPDFVFLADTVCCAQTAVTFAARPGFATLRAVQQGHVYGLNDSLASEWGPRVVDFLQTVATDVTQPAASPSPAGSPR